MIIELDTEDLIGFVSLIPQYIKKIGEYQPMCGDDFEFDKEELEKYCRYFLTQQGGSKDLPKND